MHYLRRTLSGRRTAATFKALPRLPQKIEKGKVESLDRGRARGAPSESSGVCPTKEVKKAKG